MLEISTLIFKSQKTKSSMLLGFQLDISAIELLNFNLQIISRTQSEVPLLSNGEWVSL